METPEGTLRVRATVTYSYAPEKIAEAANPLTTLFTTPASCITKWVFHVYSTDTIERHISDLNIKNVPFGTECFAPSQSAAYLSSFSPGICPYGCTTASRTIISGEMNAVCCPSNYSLAGGYACASPYNTSTTAWEVLGGGLGIITDSEPTAVGHGTALVAAIHVAWQPSDLSLFPVEARPTDVVPTITTTASSSVAALSNSTASSSSTASSTNAAPAISAPSVESSSLSTGEKAGIGVGSSIFCLLLIGALILVLWRRKHRRDLHQRAGGQYMSELDGTTYQRKELHGDVIYPQEMPTSHNEAVSDSSYPKSNVHDGAEELRPAPTTASWAPYQTGSHLQTQRFEGAQGETMVTSPPQKDSTEIFSTPSIAIGEQRMDPS